MRKVREVLLNLPFRKRVNLKEQKTKYWENIHIASTTLFQGLKNTAKHFFESFHQRTAIGIEEDNYFERSNGLQTILYPHEVLPVPDNGRYKLHNEIDDCIVCDKCVKACPVDCIDIEPIRAVGEIGKTSDGTTKRIYAAKFDIDMSKCCFCGLCTTVCPTECLTMTNEFDFSEYDVKKHNFEFATLTPLEILSKKEAFENYSIEREQAAKASVVGEVGNAAKPKIKMKPVVKAAEPNEEKENEIQKPKFKPRPMIKKKK